MSQGNIAQHQQAQSIADAALSFLPGLSNGTPQEHKPEGSTGATSSQQAQIVPSGGSLPVPSIHVSPPTPLPTASRYTTPALSLNQVQLNGAPEIPPATRTNTLPSLLRYVDHDLMQNATSHDHPLQPDAQCPICLLRWDSPIPLFTNTTTSTSSQPIGSIRSTYLPLSPCGHWVHYRCLITLAAQIDSADKNKCYVCLTPLFEWDAITALTLAVRTGLELQERHKNGSFHPDTGKYASSDRKAYEEECALIDSLITQQFFTHLEQPSRFADNSPDLVGAYYAVLSELDATKRPQSKWLGYSTATGFLLFGSFVYVKMRNFLLQGHQGIVKTEGWKLFEERRLELQARLMREVHGD